MRPKKIVIIGAGPAGLAVAYELVQNAGKKKFDITIVESSDQVGGISKTILYKGFRFDLGGHRFYTKFPEIHSFYETFLKSDMLKRKRLSRIYYNQKFFNYPLNASNALKNLGIFEALRIVGSWLFRQMRRHRFELNFDQWVSNRFGDRLFQIFFKSYTEKVWGISTSELSADWAAQRIQNFNLFEAILHAFTKKSLGSKTIIEQFFYPKYGPGMLYKKLQKLIEKENVKILFQHSVTDLVTKDGKISTVVCSTPEQTRIELKADEVVSTMPFNELIKMLKPPKQLAQQIEALQFRHFITVNLIIKSNPFPDQWIYIHDSGFKVGRIQNFRNWSPFMVKPHSHKTPIGMEYFTSYNDEIWNMTDDQLVQLASQELEQLRLVSGQDQIIDGFVVRVHNAYPIYNMDYDKPLEKAKHFVMKFQNLHVCGRGGLFRYNNQDHSILTGFYVARNLIENKKLHNVWEINDDKDYLEAQRNAPQSK